MVEPRLEPWLRGTLTGVDALRRQVLHALDLASEDVDRWCAGLTDTQVDCRPFGVASVAFHLRHIARSLDRLLTYAEGRDLSDTQRTALGAELQPGARTSEVLAEFHSAVAEARRRVLNIQSNTYEQARAVGRARLPSTVGGLLVHCAEHTQRHCGQAITTARFVTAMSNDRSPTR